MHKKCRKIIIENCIVRNPSSETSKQNNIWNHRQILGFRVGTLTNLNFRYWYFGILFIFPYGLLYVIFPELEYTYRVKRLCNEFAGFERWETNWNQYKIREYMLLRLRLTHRDDKVVEKEHHYFVGLNVNTVIWLLQKVTKFLNLMRNIAIIRFRSSNTNFICSTVHIDWLFKIL